jgi:heat shock protein HslJ
MARVTRFARSWLRRSALGGVALCAFAASSCGGDDGSSGAPAAGRDLAGSQWVLDVSALGVPHAGSVSSWIKFAHGGRVTGSDGCNAFSGSYATDGSKLTFGPLAGTKKACGSPADEVARRVNAALASVRSYERTAGTLHLKDAGGKTVLTYAAGTPGVEGNWMVISVLYADAIRSVAADSHLTASFAADGTISGDTGCNTFHGDYTLQRTKLDVGPLSATKKACPTKELSEQEAGYLAALESAVRIEQTGSELTLLNAKGQMAVTLTRR